MIMALSLYVLNFTLCALAGMLCILVLTSKRVNTMHILALLYVTLTGMAFIFWLIDGMTNPGGLTPMAVFSRGLVLGGFICWVVGRIQCEHGVCQLREENWSRRQAAPHHSGGLHVVKGRRA